MEAFDLDRNQGSLISRGKRTKRRLRQTAVASTTSTSSSNSTTAISYYSVSSSMGSGEMMVSMTSSEDEDMANCLILLAQGVQSLEKQEEIKSVVVGGGGAGAGGGSDVYECKTCNRTFQSFQALGGHRASHKKPKMTPAMIPVTTYHDHDRKVEHAERERENMRITISQSKVHECSICGAEFSSGQALGGHMRRHRAPPPPPSVVKGQTIEEGHEKKNGNLLGLDLNLPAPIEDDNKFQFLSPNMVFSGPTLVYCHY